MGNDARSPFVNWSATYDGRGFLSETISPEHAQAQHDTVQPTYSSAGLLLHRNFGHPFFTSGTSTDLYIFYFAGRPVATFEKVSGSTSSTTLSYLTTDHLGTPILITNTSGSQVWQGGFEPFGADYSSSPTPLRFPGQWLEDNSGLYYNVSRWYAAGAGTYTQPDPLGLDALKRVEKFGLFTGSIYSYTDGNPLDRFDPFGASWYDWIPFIKPAKCIYYGYQCNHDVTCCLESKGLGRNRLAGDDDEIAERYSKYGKNNPEWTECVQTQKSCQKWLEYCGKTITKPILAPGMGRDPGEGAPILTPN